eukprot:TRINITY_DN7428_c0_g2_i1.p1 TRINITY_DN7428_c0_g2~~TRINITY_DN7428_c0_g2_i1.p1  ORF type:complete len:208 (+),score=2.64 TRINITY_DN7428_c0_g2_i1:91-714(+)
MTEYIHSTFGWITSTLPMDPVIAAILASDVSDQEKGRSIANVCTSEERRGVAILAVPAGAVRDELLRTWANPQEVDYRFQMQLGRFHETVVIPSFRRELEDHFTRTVQPSIQGSMNSFVTEQFIPQFTRYHEDYIVQQFADTQAIIEQARCRCRSQPQDDSQSPSGSFHASPSQTVSSPVQLTSSATPLHAPIRRRYSPPSIVAFQT